MRAPACAAAGLAALDALLSRGAHPASVLLVTSTFQEARLLEHTVDLAFPVGSFELTCTSAWGLAARLAAARSPAGALGARSRLAAAAWFRRQLPALPLRRFRPANDPSRYAAALEAHFDTLSYACIPPALYVQHALASGDPSAQELAAAYAALQALKRDAGVLDRADAVGRALELATAPRGTDTPWRHVIALDAHNLGPPALRLLLSTFPPAAAPVAASAATGAPAMLEPLELGTAGSPLGLLPRSVHVCLDPARAGSGGGGDSAWGGAVARTLQRLSTRAGAAALGGSSTSGGTSSGGGGGYEWTCSLRDEAAACGHPALVRAATSRLIAGGAAPARDATPAPRGSRAGGKAAKQPGRLLGDAPSVAAAAPLSEFTGGAASKGAAAAPLFSAAELTSIGAAHSQSTVLDAGCDPAQPHAFLVSVGVPTATDRYEAAARSIALLAHKLLLQQPGQPQRASGRDAAPAQVTVCVACRSNAHASSLHASLRSVLLREQRGECVELLSDSTVRLGDVEEVRALVAALGCLAHPGDLRHAYNLATSALYGVPVPAMAALVQRAGSLRSPVGGSAPPTAPAGDLGGLRALLEEAAAAASPATQLAAASLSQLKQEQQPLPPHGALAFRRLLLDLDDLASSYARGPRSASAALARFVRRCGLANALSDPASARDSTAAASVGALLQLLQELEAAAGGAATAGQLTARDPSRPRALLQRGHAGQRGSHSGMYTTPTAAGAPASELEQYSTSGGGLPSLFAALQAAVMDEGASLRADAFDAQSGSAMPAALLAPSDDDESAAELAAALGSAVDSDVSREPAPLASSSFSSSSLCANALEAPTTVAVLLALERARQARLPMSDSSSSSSSSSSPACEQLRLADFSSAVALLSQPGEAQQQPGGSAPPRVTVVITTERRALSHQYDVLVLPWASDSSMPGSFYKPPLPLPEPLFDAARLLPELAVGDGASGEVAAPATATAHPPHPRTASEHVDWARHRLRLLMTQARRGVLFVCPVRSPSAPASSLRRSRFVTELFGPPPALAALSPPPPSVCVPSPPAAAAGSAPTAPLPSPPGSTDAAVAAQPPASPSPRDATGSAPGEPAALLELAPMSFTAISEYEWCPHRYYLRRVARLPQPVPAPAALLYGRALHEAAAVCGRATMAAVAAAWAECPLPPGNDGAAAPALSRPDGQLGLTGAALALDRLRTDGAFRAALLRSLPAGASLEADMAAAYDRAWRGEDAGAASTRGPPPPPVGVTNDHAHVPPWQAAELRGEAVRAIAAFQRRERTALLAALDALDAGGARCGSGCAGGAAVVAVAVAAVAPAVAAPEAAAAAVATSPAAPLLPPAAPLALPALVEQRFDLPLHAVGVMLTGVIDRVDVCVGSRLAAPEAAAAAAGDAREAALPSPPPAAPALVATVREFKTSMQWRDPGHLRRQGADSKQLSLYALALRRLAHGEVAEAAAGRRHLPPPVAAVLATTVDEAAPARVALESIELQAECHVVAVGRKQAAELLAVLAQRRASIRAGDFAPAPSLVACDVCAYRSVCAHAHGTRRSSATPAAVRAGRRAEQQQQQRAGGARE